MSNPVIVALSASNSSNNSQTAAYTVPSTCDILTVTGSEASGNSIILQNNLTLNQSIEIVVNTEIDNQVNLFPPVGGSIGGQAINTALVIPVAGGSITLSYSGSSNYAITVPLVLNTFGITLVPITGSTTIRPSQQGSVFTVSKSSSYTITLPPANVATNVGLQYTFISGPAGIGSVSISDGGARMNGINIQMGHIVSAVLSAAQNQNSHTFTSSSIEGDTMEMICDGTVWRSIGTSGAIGALTCP